MARSARVDLVMDAASAVSLLEGLERNAVRVSDQLDIIAKGALEWERDLIGSQGAVGRSPWPKDAVATMERKHNQRVMVETGRLVEMLLGKPRRTTMAIKVTGPAYALWHQVGTKRMPRRNIMGIPPRARIVPVIEELLAAMLDVNVRRAS